MNGIGDFVASIKETQRLAAQIVIEIKGESEGHPFRGNQWSGGGATSAESGQGDSFSKNDPARIKKLTSEREKYAARIEKLQSEANPKFEGISDDELIDRKDRYAKNIGMITRGHPELSDHPDVAMWKTRYQAAQQEYDRRKEIAVSNRRIRAIDEGLTTGKVTVTQSEMASMVNNQGDAYHDNHYRGEYNPDAMHTSDYTGRAIRHYVTLPTGERVHPDELHEAQRRGRVVVVQ